MGVNIFWVDSEGRPRSLSELFQIDPLSASLVTIDHPHHEIHDGNAFTACKISTHGAGASPNILIVTPNEVEEVHFIFLAVSDNVLQVDFYESPDYSGGDSLEAFIRNRNLSHPSNLTLTTDATDDGSGKGTKIWTFKAGVNRTVTTSESARFEFILKRDTKYLLETIGVNNDNITALLEWYEHAPLVE